MRKRKEGNKEKRIGKVGHEFILGLLLSLRTGDDQSHALDFSTQINELIQSDSANKLFLIVKYFGKHPWVTEKSL